MKIKFKVIQVKLYHIIWDNTGSYRVTSWKTSRTADILGMYFLKQLPQFLL